MPFLSISGLPVAITDIQEQPRFLIGERVRMLDGTLRSTVRGYYRRWRARTIPLDIAAETQLRSLTGKTIVVTVFGDFVPEPVSCLVTITGGTFLPGRANNIPNAAAYKQLDLAIEEVGTGTIPVPDPARTVATVPTVQAGQQRPIQIQVFKTDGSPEQSGGATIVVTITGANPGTPTVVDHDDGTYTAVDVPGTAGTDQVTITMDGSPIQGSPYAALVQAVSGVVTQVVVTPGSAGVFVGGTTQFTADPRDAGGATVPGQTITWETQSGGTTIISPSSPGAVTTVQGIAAGSDGVQARVGSIVSGFKTVTVTVPVSGSNRPPGMTLLGPLEMDSIPPVAPARSPNGWSVVANGRTRVVSIGPVSGLPVGNYFQRIFIPPTMAGGGGSINFERGFSTDGDTPTPHREVFIEQWKRLSPFFRMQGNVGMKDKFIDNGTEGDPAPYSEAYLNSFPNAGINIQGQPSSINRNMKSGFLLTNRLNQWVKHERYLKMHSVAGLADGIGRGWFNGVLDNLLDLTDILWLPPSRNPNVDGFTKANLTNTYGGGNSAGPGVTGVGGNGFFDRDDGVPGTVDATGRIFTRNDGGDFNTMTRGPANRNWSFGRPDGTFVTALRIATTTSTTLTTPTGSPSIAGCQVAYPTWEPFDAAAVGKVIYMTKQQLINEVNNPARDDPDYGTYPLVLGPVTVLGRSTSPGGTLWNRLTFAGDATLAGMLFGMVVGMSGPIYIDYCQNDLWVRV